MPSAVLLATIERSRKRLWGLCYRMTGLRSDADDLSQEAIARAIEREPGLAHRERLDGWLLRIATTVCLDHLRRRAVERRATELVDPVDAPELSPARSAPRDPEAAVILRDDVRFAVVVALQRLSPRQRAAVILHDVLDCPLLAVAESLATNPNAAKELVVRGRAALARARVHTDVDVVVDPVVVERLACAIAARSIDELTALLAEDAWGVADGGRMTKPVFGRRAVSRLWLLGARRHPGPVACERRVVNGEPVLVLTAPASGGAAIAMVHAETRRGRISALRVIRDPHKLAYLTAPAAVSPPERLH